MKSTTYFTENKASNPKKKIFPAAVEPQKVVFSAAAADFDRPTAYTDGSYRQNHKKTFSGSGVVLYNKDRAYLFSHTIKGDLKASKNVGAELCAALIAVEYCRRNNIPSVDIRYDCMDVQHMALIRHSSNSVAQAYYDRMQEAMKTVNVTFTKVKGHSAADPHNYRADGLAKSALRGGSIAAWC